MPDATPEVRHNEAAGRFEIDLDGELAVLDYSISNGRMVMPHTEVPVAHRGHGYADLLAHAALTHARDKELTPVPVCPFVRGFIERHPEYGSKPKP